jgi:diguanylate cyclase (GGDEF)-like protein/PAS domain S-box-containing protein
MKISTTQFRVLRLQQWLLFSTALFWGTALILFFQSVTAVENASGGLFPSILLWLSAVFAVCSAAAFLVVRAVRKTHESLTNANAELAAKNSELQNSETHFRELFENANDPIYTIDLQGNFTSLNKAGEIFIGYTSAELCRLNVADVVAPEYLELSRQMMKLKLSDKIPVIYEIELITKNKQRVTGELSTGAIFRNGEPVAMQGILHNVTARKKIELELQKNLSLLTSTFEATADAILVVDRNNRIVTYNQRFIDVWQIPDEIVIARDNSIFVDFVLNQLVEPESFLEKTAALHCRPEAHNYDNLEFKDGRFYERYSHPQILDGEVIGRVVSLRDITERKRVENTLRQSQANLAAAQRITHLGSWEVELTDLRRLNNNKTTWSDEVYRIFGYEPGQFEVSINDYFASVHPAERASVRRAFLEAVSYRQNLNIEYRIVLPHGSVRIHHGQAEVLYDEKSGKPLKFIGTVQDVTERRQAEDKIRESKEWLQAVFDASRDGILIEDGANIAYINKFYAQFLGYETPEDLIGKPVASITPPAEAERLEEYGQMRLRGEEAPTLYEFTNRRQDGTPVTVEGAVSTAIIGGKKYIMTAVRDIAERRRAEEAVRQSEEKYRTILETIEEGYYEVDLAGSYTFFNDAVAHTLKYDKEVVKGLNFRRFVDKKTAVKLIHIYRKVFFDRQPVSNLECEIICQDGGRIVIESSVAVILDKGGDPIGFRGVVRDVSARKRSEEALRESENKFRTLIESTSEGLLQVDNEDGVLFVNSRLCEMVGYSADELMGANWIKLLVLDEEKALINQANERRQRGISDRYEICLKAKCGESVWVTVSGAPILDSEGVVTGSLGVFSDITTRKRAEEQLLHDAFHDNLTGLANRALFMDHLRMTIERGKSRHSNPYAVLFLDFDRFKVINDSLGHAEGDLLLKQIARRLESATRTGDLVGRLGGDEFVVLLSEMLVEEDAVQVAERIQESLENPFDLTGNEVYISASIGIALSAAGHLRAEDMLRDADIAMYRAKAKGRARYQVFDQEMHQQATSHLQLETEMRQALELGEFALYYQPIINLETSRLAGFEALVRWNHPERGLMLPVEFIPAAEENNLILPLGRWILQESCRQLREWQKKNPAAEDLKVSVNLSSKQFLQSDLAEQVVLSLVAADLAPRCLKLEITESYLMDNSEKVTEIMERLRKIGVEISLDDFGTGYSSLSYLHRLPVDYLKIDRSFVSRITDSRENSEIVYTIIKLAQNLKMKVIAEGIETLEQLEHLKNLNCEYGQGFYFSKPVEASSAERFIVENTPDFSFAVKQNEFGVEQSAMVS